jgi:hypothetical protein
MANTFNLGNKKWAVKKDKVLAYNSENNNFKPLPFDFARASDATVVNKSGIIEEVGQDEPRIDFLDNTNGHLLLEPSRTNLVTYSIPTNSSPYSYSGGGVGTAPTHTANAGISPDGTQNAARIDFNINGGTTSGDISQVSYVGSALTGDYTSSFYLKSFDSNSYIVTLLDTNGATTTATITSEWQRFTFYNGGGTTSTNLIRIRLRGNESTSDTASLLAWGFQLEQATYATSYIPTNGSSVTRVVDDITQTMPSVDSFSSLGSVTTYIELQPRPLTGTNSTGNNIVFEFPSGNRIVYNQNSASQHRIEINSAGTASYYGTSILTTESVKIAVKVTSTTVVIYANGTLQDSATLPSTGDYTILNSIDTAITDAIGNIKIADLRFYNTGLTDAELIALTS